VDDAVERLCHSPHLLHAQAPDLWEAAAQAEVLDRGTGQMTLSALREHGRAGVHLDARFERRQRLALAAESLGACLDTANRALRHQQPLGIRLGQHHHAQLLGTVGQVAAELGQREDQISLVVERRRRRDPQLESLGHQVDRLLGDRPVAAGQRREVLARQQVAEGGGIHDRAGQQVGAGDAALVQHRDRRLTQPLGGGRIRLEQLRQPDRAGQPGRAGADERDADVDSLVLVRLRRLDELAHLDRRWVCAGPPCHGGRCYPSRAFLGRATSSPPQLGQTLSSSPAQATQKVHSKLQMRASPSAGSAA
jgi:hypothetical protein